MTTKAWQNLTIGILAVTCATCLPGCCSMSHGVRQNISISSVPASAKVSLDGRWTGCYTPVIINLPRRNSCRIVLEKAGYAPSEVQIQRQIDGATWILGNIILGGVVGMTIDACTGAMFTLTPSDIRTYLQKRHGGEPMKPRQEEGEDCIAPNKAPEATR